MNVGRCAAGVRVGVIRCGVARGLTDDNGAPGAQANKFKEVA
jgi:hypothetical protein